MVIPMVKSGSARQKKSRIGLLVIAVSHVPIQVTTWEIASVTALKTAVMPVASNHSPPRLETETNKSRDKRNQQYDNAEGQEIDYWVRHKKIGQIFNYPSQHSSYGTSHRRSQSKKTKPTTTQINMTQQATAAACEALRRSLAQETRLKD